MANNNTLQAYTPGSDIAAAFQPYQINWGRTGNDILIGYNSLNGLQDPSTLDVLVGDIEIPLLADPYPRNWRNKFILGDWRKPYYANGNPFLLGLNDLAIIIDFDPTSDIIQLNGRASDYQTFEFFLGTVIWRQQQIIPGISVPDVVAIIPTLGLDLKANYFKYTGSTPPSPSLPQGKQIGTTGFELGNSITVDRDGYVYVAGGTSGDLGSPNQGNRDVWFAKYDRRGNEIWRKQFGTNSFDFPFGITVDKQGNIYLAGSTQGNLGAPLVGDISDAWLAKFDRDGNSVWVRQFGNRPYFAHNAYALDVDARGNIRVSGVSVKNTPEGSSLPTTADAWVASYDTNGNQQWFRQFGTPNNETAFDESYALSVDRQGNAFTAGFTTGAIGSTPFGGLYDAWVAKHDNRGNLLWAQNIGSADYDWAWDTATDSGGNVYVTGWTLGNLGGANAGSFDAWLAKYDRSGNLKWISQFGTAGDDEAFGVEVDERNNVYVTGYTDGAFAGRTNRGDFDAWVTKFDSRGNRQWVQQFGTAGTEQAYDITVQGKNIYVTGLTDGSFNTTNQGSFDAWVVNLETDYGRIKNFTGTASANVQPKRSGSEILGLNPIVRQTEQGSRSLTSQPSFQDLGRLATGALARALRVSPNTLTDLSSLQNLASDIVTPYEGTETASLYRANQSLTTI